MGIYVTVIWFAFYSLFHSENVSSHLGLIEEILHVIETAMSSKLCNWRKYCIEFLVQATDSHSGKIILRKFWRSNRKFYELLFGIDFLEKYHIQPQMFLVFKWNQTELTHFVMDIMEIGELMVVGGCACNVYCEAWFVRYWCKFLTKWNGANNDFIIFCCVFLRGSRSLFCFVQ